MRVFLRIPKPGIAPGLALLLLALPLAGCAGPPSDRDNDGLSDAQETTPRDITLRLQQGAVHRQVTSDPAVNDTDGDGLDDGQESNALTDPRDVDSDNDGLLDGPTLSPAPGSAFETLLLSRNIVRDTLGRFVGEDDTGTRSFDWDSDRPLPDGLSDGDEVRGWNVTTTKRGTYHVTSDPRVPDTDNDGLSDLDEKRLGCDPRLADTDGDGVPDPLDADCAHDLHLAITVSKLLLLRDKDPQGGANLLIEAQAAGQTQTYRQDLHKGDNNVTFAWDVDVPDQGPAGHLVVAVVLAFWDEDLAGNDAQSGVPKQALSISPSPCFNAQCNAVQFQVDLLARTWTTQPGSVTGTGGGTLEGADAKVNFTLQPLLD